MKALYVALAVVAALIALVLIASSIDAIDIRL